MLVRVIHGDNSDEDIWEHGEDFAVDNFGNLNIVGSTGLIGAYPRGEWRRVRLAPEDAATSHVFDDPDADADAVAAWLTERVVSEEDDD